MATTPEAAPASAVPTPVSLPDATEFLTDAQWKILMAIMDTVIPAIRIQEESTTNGAQQQRDLGTIYLPSGEYSDAAIKLRNASSPLNHSSDVLEAYLAERPSDNPLFTTLLKGVLTNVPPSKQRDIRILFSILKSVPPAAPSQAFTTLTHLPAPARAPSSSPLTPPRSPPCPSPTASRSSNPGAPPRSLPSAPSSRA